MHTPLVKALFLDIGGLLLTNGWDHGVRKKVAETFKVDYEEMNRRHQLVFDTFETGKISFDDYLRQVIFYEKRSFSIEEVKRFACELAVAYTATIEYFKELKARYQLKIGVVSNEGRELAIDRIKRFSLAGFVDFFIVSSFVHFRKPDLDIYRLAIDVAQISPTQIVYIDDRSLLVEVARGVGLQGIHHTHLESTQAAVNLFLGEEAFIPK